MSSSTPSLISRIARHGLTGVGIALIAGAGLVAQVQAAAASADEPSVTAKASQAVAATAASVRGALQGPGLGIREISERIEALGYRDLREIEWDDGLYKVKGLASDGRAVKLYVDGHSGNVLSVRTRH
ncbi:PepSY domain-containing protein [Delftia sp. PS-11]|uniref:PepSY domain-containing protein n=1 Tax=Delftia sp. PS-11 TaxID=2767222 RepID=UPI002458DC2E|nr:PepSY domain-containing protein [Delftia sp. PS-11]KAJ8745124.1 PepSY domain-containing protein [Delftia sp. PS-11]